MKSKLMVSVLLLSMAVTAPVCADNDRTPDEYDPDAKYESPLNQTAPVAVNEHRKVKTANEGDAFAQAAGKFMQGAASGKRSEIEKAEKQAEKILSETDENFEPAPNKEFPGYEYQAHDKAYSKPESKKALDNTGALRTEKKSLEAKHPEKAEPGLISDRSKGKNIKAKGKTKNENLPLVITGDDAQYASESGDFSIEGNVCLQQGLTRFLSTKAVGNTKTGDVWLLEGGTLQEQANRANVHWAHYNFNQKTGELLRIKGASSADTDGGKKDLFEAPHGIIENGMLILDQGGTATRCPAVKSPPCLSVKAKSITIIPNDRIVAKDVQVFVKGKQIYSRKVWVNDLKRTKNPITPHIGWKSKKGFYVALDYEHPIGNPLLKNPTTFSMHQAYYTKSHYKPFYSIRHEEPDFYVRLNDGYVYDSDNDLFDDGIWLHKKTDWGLFLKPHRIAKGIPLIYDGYITHGLWKYEKKSWSSWHTEARVNLRLDRIYPFGGKKLYLDLMAGHKWVNESLDNEITRKHGKNLSTNIYQGTIGYRFSKKWNIWETYRYEHKTSYLFSLGQPNFSQEWRTGIAWTPDDRNSFVIVNRYNSDNSSRSHGNYSTRFSWTHRFCCELLTVSYERKHYKHDNQWTVKLHLANW